MGSDLSWHAYKAKVTVLTLEEFLDEVDRDLYGCFFG